MLKKTAAFVKKIKKELRIYQAILKDKRTPLLAKVLLGLAIGYILMPFDLIPDFIPIIGQLDDFIFAALLILIALKFIPRQVVQEHRKNIN